MTPGDLKKTIEIVIRDDIEPEDSETLMIGLVNTEGGSRILPSSDTVTIVILANDYVAGIIGFHPTSRSVIVREGKSLFLFYNINAIFTFGILTGEHHVWMLSSLLFFLFCLMLCCNLRTNKKCLEIQSIPDYLCHSTCTPCVLSLWVEMCTNYV